MVERKILQDILKVINASEVEAEDSKEKQELSIYFAKQPHCLEALMGPQRPIPSLTGELYVTCSFRCLTQSCVRG